MSDQPVFLYVCAGAALHRYGVDPARLTLTGKPARKCPRPCNMSGAIPACTPLRRLQQPQHGQGRPKSRGGGLRHALRHR